MNGKILDIIPANLRPALIEEVRAELEKSTKKPEEVKEETEAEMDQFIQNWAGKSNTKK